MNEQFIFGLIISSILWAVLVVILYRTLKVKEEALKEKYDRFIHVVENTKDFIYYCEISPEIKFKYLSPSAEYFFGDGSIAKAYQSPNVAFTDIHPDDYDILMKKINGELDYKKGIVQRWKDKNGIYRCFEEYTTPIYENGKIVALQGVLRNIDEKVELQNQLEYRLYHDNLTNLYNRGYFERIFEKYNQQINIPVAIIICDLDELKLFNDNYGHKVGDELIQETARLLNQFSSEKITVARLGGDEFALIVAGVTVEEVEDLLNNILKEVETHNASGSNIRVKMSMGYGISNGSKGKMEEIFNQADKNMYKSKEDKKKLLIY
ncbi:sensor domain-containing diguanylate cyclase [Bacillus sp. HNG]|uniref:sensor domain-containing diguanylate cyclase n=1 Tax=Bacillus sp. HNG TaxID=2293325 RepID=UPI000E2F240C|nr:sensor domain-containing diguanylate cyclase [Bacillus sp. HNG]RFB15204.1 sensor domain-containing diguanylate cyclase [Bacillus sp. HNG]